jgi:hypothetical protein
MQHHVLGGHARAEVALHAHFHRLRLLEQQRLRGQHMLHLGCADAEGQRAQPAVAGRVQIAANNRGARQRKALFRPHHMHNALLAIRIADQADAEFGRVAFQRGKLLRAFRVLDGDAMPRAIAPRGGGQVVIGHRQRKIGAAHLAAATRNASNACGLVTS